ncbi:helix-turn-helix domain-containing protein [Curtobacterium sp. MCPF17_002]|uniref:TetR/AcrR family transcriptional regulator n=1 Tax=Curtobacterium sp. MCPF17_002 TaxID=2175645 RepID=UPI000DA745AE|nr:TetR/AcrR family transcriptional regulator [Curtobacterium sp. MCPF17_002]WIB78279.1 helix-turn-helix domain-containing protein [Curtobacterium sp. MCPF17_002]
MDTDAPDRGTRRTGAETRRRAQQIALELFTEHGYEATSLRRIADVLGINKASLYYHFPSKEAILRSLFDERGAEADELVEWLRTQDRTPELLETAVLRWVGSFSADKLRGIRFMAANPLVVQGLAAAGADRIGSPLNTFVDELTELLPRPTAENALLLRMSVLSINAAVQAAAGHGDPDESVITAAGRAARALLREIGQPA